MQQRIGVLMARVASPRDCDSPASERLRHDVQQQTPMERSLSWNKLNVPSSPQRVQSPSSPLAHLPHLKEVRRFGFPSNSDSLIGKSNPGTAGRPL